MIDARVREIAAAADPLTRTFAVKLDIGSSANLRLGQTATVLLERPQTGGIAKLPLSALKEEQGRTHVWVVDPASMTVKLTPVQVAGADGNDAVIAAGLASGMRVVTAGVHVLTPGQKVRLYEASAAAAAPAAASANAAAVQAK